VGYVVLGVLDMAKVARRKENNGKNILVDWYMIL
jgi:hypothetical protein